MRYLLIILMFFSCQKQAVVKDYRKAQKDSIKRALVDSIAKDTLNKSLLGTVKFKKVKVLLYDNFTWKYKFPEQKIKPKTNKKIQSFYEPDPVYKTNYSHSSGRCGARTKSGTPCQRRVKGGGRCWQHS